MAYASYYSGHKSVFKRIVRAGHTTSYGLSPVVPVNLKKLSWTSHMQENLHVWF